MLHCDWSASYDTQFISVWTKCCIVIVIILDGGHWLDFSHWSMTTHLGLCLSSFPRVETRFNTHYQNAYANAFRNAFLELLRLSSHSIASTSREEGLVTAQLHCAVWPVEQRSCRAHAFTLVGRRYKGVSKQLCVYQLYRNVFLAQTRIRSHFFRRFRKAFLTP